MNKKDLKDQTVNLGVFFVYLIPLPTKLHMPALSYISPS